MTAPPCGTYRACQRHVYRGEPLDPACEEARRAYLAAYRASHPETVERGRQAAKVRRKAVNRLIAAHPVEFARLLDEVTRLGR